MRWAVGSLNVLLGVVYTQYGTMAAIELRRGWRNYGFSHFGAAWVFMAFTCGPHHLFHGLHGLIEGRMGGPLDLAAVLVGLPAGVAWFLLRVEAFRGGRGDRFVTGTPAWIGLLPSVAGVYVTALVAAMLWAGRGMGGFPKYVYPNLALIVLYSMIGYFLTRTQLRNRGPLGGWSVSGVSLAIVFPTCALMHAVFAFYAMTGRYAFDIHGFVIDVLGVPAAMYFLWVVRGLYREAIRDWNEEWTGVSPQMVRAR